MCSRERRSSNVEIRATLDQDKRKILRADSLVTASYSSSFLCNLEKLPFLVLFKSSSSFFLNFEDHFLVLPIFFRSEIFRSEEIFEKLSRSFNTFFFSNLENLCPTKTLFVSPRSFQILKTSFGRNIRKIFKISIYLFLEFRKVLILSKFRRNIRKIPLL